MEGWTSSRGHHLTINKGDDFSGPSTNLPQGGTGVLSGTGDGGTRGGGNLGETLRGLGGGRRGTLTGLGGSLGGGGGVPDSGSPDEELRLPKDGTGRRSGHLEGHLSEETGRRGRE